MRIENVKSGIAFTGTPVLLSGLYVPGVDPDGLEYLQVRRGAEKYNFSLGGLDEMDVSEILDSLAPPLPDPDKSEEPCRLLADWSELGAHLFSFSVWNGSGEDSGEIDIHAFRGGVSRQNCRRMRAEDTDIFTYRLLNPKRNIFFTTRPGRNVILKESEMYPLLFLIQGDDRNLRISERVSASHIDYPLARGGLYALDPEAARRAFVAQSGVLASLLDVELDGEKTCRIIIAAEDPEPERYRLKFRNSFGAFEIFCMQGPMEITPEYEEESGYKKVDNDMGGYVKGRRRATLTDNMTVSTGWLDRRGVSFFFDLVSSEEVWLLDRGEDPVRVIPSIQEVTYLERPGAPVRFRLSLTPADSDTYLTPDITDDSGGIFTQEFNPPFN